MKKVLQIALGIVAAVGGFVDIGELVFDSQAGATYRYGLLWAVVVGVIGIVVYAEMCGRVAMVARRPVFDVVRHRMGFGLGLMTLIASLFVNLLTLAAEVGGVAIVLELLFNVSYSFLIIAAVLGLGLVIKFVPFNGIERIFGYGGLALLVYVAAAYHLHPDWHAVANGFVPHAQSSSLYWYFVVGVVGAAVVPYEVYFYSSGVLEEGWTPEEDSGVNKANAILGFGLGGLLSVGLIIVSAQILAPRGIDAAYLGTTALNSEQVYAQVGLLLALLGMLFAIGGAAIECAMSGAYCLAQFAGWDWGKYRESRGVPRFTLTWIGMLVVALLIVETGLDPVDITEYAVVFSVAALPLTYLPMLLIARDRTYMGRYANGIVSNVIGWAYFAIILVVSVAAIPLLLATNGGGG